MIKAVIFDYGGVINRNLRKQRDLIRFSRELRRTNIQTAVLSNMAQSIAWFITLKGDFRGFKPVVISSRVGVAKPDPKIYKIILEKLSLEPTEVIFIDNRPGNLVPAKAMGMAVVHAENTQQVIEDVKKIISAIN
jgi:putative hydrolase of the HAD superfamily